MPFPLINTAVLLNKNFNLLLKLKVRFAVKFERLKLDFSFPPTIPP